MSIASTTKCFAGLALSLTLIVGATATAQAGGSRANGARAASMTHLVSQSGPVVRDHPGEGASGAAPSTSGWNGNVHDHRSGQPQVCIGGLFGGLQCGH